MRGPERCGEGLGSDEARLGRPYPGEDGRAHLVRRYYTRQEQLHGKCFYNGPCDPLDETERRIQKTSDYIDDAERLAEGETL